MNALKTEVAHLVGSVVAPQKTFASRLLGQGTALLPLLAYGAMQLAIAGEALYKSLHLFSSAPESVTRRLVLDTLWRRGSAHADLAILLVVATVLAIAGRWISPAGIHPKRTLAASASLLVTVTLGMAIGLLARLFGAELWFLPHTAIDSPAILVVHAGAVQVSWVRFAVKCAVSYGPTFVIVCMVLRDFWVVQERRPLALGTRFVAGTVLVAGLIVAAIAASAVHVVNAAKDLRPVVAGDLVPDAKLRWLAFPDDARPAGRTFSPEDFRGKILVIDFWASWCAPCRRSIPELSRLAKEYGEAVAVVGVNREPRDVDAAKEAFAGLKFGFPSAIDQRGGTRSGFGERIGIQSLPTSLVVDREGIVRHIHLGYTPEAKLRAELDALVQEGKTP